MSADPLLVAQLDQSALYATQLNNALLQQHLAAGQTGGYADCGSLDSTTAQQLLEGQQMLIQAATNVNVGTLRPSPAKHLQTAANSYSRACCEYISSQTVANQSAAYALLSHAGPGTGNAHPYLVLDTSGQPTQSLLDPGSNC